MYVICKRNLCYTNFNYSGCYGITIDRGMNFIRTRIKYIILAIFIVILIDHFGLLVHLFEVDYYTKFSYPIEISIDELFALKNGKKSNISPINEYKYQFKIKNENKCKQNNEKIVLLYAVKSALPHEKRRNIIRKTWGWENRFSDVVIKRIFLLGISNDSHIQKQIEEENNLYKDIVQGKFVDTYYNNTIKTLMGFRWVIESCSNAEFIMFSDDDMYISTKNVLKFIHKPFNKQIQFRKRRNVLNDISQELNKIKYINTSDNLAYKRYILNIDTSLSAYDGRLFAGYVFFSSPMRHKSSKWYVTLAEYPYSMYPPYVTAGAYILSYPALLDMYYTSMFTKHFKFDDIYLGIVAKKCGIMPLHNEHFYFWKKPYYKDDYANVIASHGYEDAEMLMKVWNEQRSLGNA